MNFKLLIFAFVLFTRAAEEICYLSQQEPIKAFPNLIKCYKNNAKACCVSAHDNQIMSKIQDFLSPSCERRFPELEYYFCYGCHKDELVSLNSTSKEIFMCKNYAEILWGADLDEPTTIFDTCGFKLGNEIVIPS